MIAGERFYPANAVSFTMAEQRAFYDLYCAHFRKPRPENLAVKDFAVGPVLCRLYQPKPSKDLPVMLYLHGGGYVLGGLESHDDVCAEISDGADIAVVGVNYRLAPEHPFPAAFNDAWAVLQHLSGRYDKIIVGGDSAGGNLSAAVALKARDEEGPQNCRTGFDLSRPGWRCDQGFLCQPGKCAGSCHKRCSLLPRHL